MKWRSEAITRGAEAALGFLGKTGVARRFYLAGGTALALRLGHRVSRDLDLFSRTDKLALGERGRVLSELGRARRFALDEEKEGTIHGRLGGTHLSLFHYPYPLVRRSERYRGIEVVSLEDIGLMKLAAAIGRGIGRDFVDLYFLCQEVPLDRLLAMAPRKFPRTRDFVLQALKALVFFDDAEREPPPPTLRPARWHEIRGFFEAEVRRLSAREFG